MFGFQFKLPSFKINCYATIIPFFIYFFIYCISYGIDKNIYLQFFIKKVNFDNWELQIVFV